MHRALTLTTYATLLIFYGQQLHGYTQAHLLHLQEILNKPIKNMSQTVDTLVDKYNSPEAAHHIRAHLHNSSSKNAPSAHWAQQCIEECKMLATEKNHQQQKKKRFFKKKDLLFALLFLASFSIAMYCALKLPELIKKVQQLCDEKASVHEQITQPTEHLELTQQLELTPQLQQEITNVLSQQQSLTEQINTHTAQLNQRQNELNTIQTRIQNLESQVSQTDHSHTEHINQLHNELNNLQQLYTSRIETCISEYDRMIQALNTYSQTLCEQAPMRIEPMSFINRLSNLLSRETIRDISHTTYAINNTSQAMRNTQSVISSVGNLFDAPSSTHENASLLSQLPSVPQTTPRASIYAS